jgi:dihydroneopterin aldolase
MTARKPEKSGQSATRPASAGRDHIFVRDWVIDCNIGVYAEEKGVTQKVRLTVDAFLAPAVRSAQDDMEEVPSYTDIIDGVNEIASKGHINLLETFAERIAAHCLEDKRIASVRVRIEKLERGPVRGVDITRTRTGSA